MLHSVLKLGSCNWNWVVADATWAPWLVPESTSQVPTPCTSTKSRLPDTDITKGCRSLHLLHLLKDMTTFNFYLKEIFDVEGKFVIKSGLLNFNVINFINLEYSTQHVKYKHLSRWSKCKQFWDKFCRLKISIQQLIYHFNDTRPFVLNLLLIHLYGHSFPIAGRSSQKMCSFCVTKMFSIDQRFMQRN